MRLLCLSNGHGEDAIALRILQALQQQPQPPEIVALPIVGNGTAYTQHGISLVGAVKSMPSGGFIYMDGWQLARDVRGGLLQLTRAQLKTVRDWTKQGGSILAVGDIVPLLFAWRSGAPYAFVGTAKSEYYLRDEQGTHLRSSWFEQLEGLLGSVYSPWERWLMQQPRCRAVFPRDRLTAETLKQWNIPSFDLGNPMMDGLEPAGIDFGVESDRTFALLPGSRAPEAYENWRLLLQATAALQAEFESETLLFLAAIAPSLDRAVLEVILISHGWQPVSSRHLTFGQANASLVLTPAFNDCLHQAEVAIAMAGTATEQFVGLGKPAITLPGRGPQFTPAFAEAQTRLLGMSVILVESPAAAAGAVRSLDQNALRLQQIRASGGRRMGQAGAAQRIANGLSQVFSSETIQKAGS